LAEADFPHSFDHALKRMAIENSQPKENKLGKKSIAKL
jgi:hypothetical protein